MDKSYIHNNYQRQDDSIFDTNDEHDLEAMQKGRQYCFVAAIIDKNRFVQNVSDKKLPFISEAHLMHDTYGVFEGEKKKTADYHGMFDTNYLARWMHKLSDTL